MLTISRCSKIDLKLLGFFFVNPQSSCYLRELSRKIKCAAGSLQRSLGRLEREGVLKSAKEGPLKFFSLNPNYPYFPELQSVVLRENRRLALEKDLKKVLVRLKKEYRPEKIVLFGSLASGRVSPNSDLDILLIKRHVPERYWDRIREVAPLLVDSSVGIDFVVWRPDELEAEMRKNFFLKKEIFEKGKILYERAA